MKRLLRLVAGLLTAIYTYTILRLINPERAKAWDDYGDWLREQASLELTRIVHRNDRKILGGILNEQEVHYSMGLLQVFGSRTDKDIALAVTGMAAPPSLEDAFLRGWIDGSKQVVEYHESAGLKQDWFLSLLSRLQGIVAPGGPPPTQSE